MLFYIRKCKIYISFPLLAIMVFFISVDNTYTVLIGFLGAFLHELGHIFVMCIYGKAPKEIKLRLFDIAIVDNNIYRNHYEKLAISAAGITVNFTIFVICTIIYKFCMLNIFLLFGTVNLLLALFNLLPSDELDGGQILNLIISYKFSENTAKKVMNIISAIITVFLFIFGFFILCNFKYNFTPLLCGIYLAAGRLLKNKK